MWPWHGKVLSSWWWNWGDLDVKTTVPGCARCLIPSFRQVDVICAKVHCNFVAIDGAIKAKMCFPCCFPICNIYNIYNAITIYLFIGFSNISNLEMSTVLSKTASFQATYLTVCEAVKPGDLVDGYPEAGFQLDGLMVS